MCDGVTFLLRLVVAGSLPLLFITKSEEKSNDRARILEHDATSTAFCKHFDSF